MDLSRRTKSQKDEVRQALGASIAELGNIVGGPHIKNTLYGGQKPRYRMRGRLKDAG
jgi:hypothetical protein